MTYQDALDYLRIAENAYNVQAYSESAEIVEKLAYFAVEITEAVKQAIGRFTFCPDEYIWEKTCGLIDLFRWQIKWRLNKEIGMWRVNYRYNKKESTCFSLSRM